MGSFFAQSCMFSDEQSIDGFILSGTSGKQPMALLGRFLAKFLIQLQGEKHRSKIIYQLTSGQYNSFFKPTKTNSDWLSRDSELVQQYIQDPYCGFLCTTRFYHELFKGLSMLHHKNNLLKISKELPILIFSGDHDPVGDHSRSVKKLIQQYKSLRIQNLEYKFYPEGRHEMLNEVNRDEVIADIIDWLDKRF